MVKNNTSFSKKLILWYLQNQRELPWRSTSNPYFIWLSEIILQQTRVSQGLPYYYKFIEAFPSIEELAEAEEAQILKLWQGLGYYSRARNLHATAKYIAYDLKGIFPNSYDGLMKLKGVGDYTASAIASICFKAPTAVVDGNVYRVLSRLFGIETPINSSEGIKTFKELAQHLLDESQPGIYNQAIMEFGARYCVPQSPDCLHCIFNDKCEAFKNKSVLKFPVKHKNGKIRKRFFNYIVFISDDERTIVQQRREKGIWRNLYEFPLIESNANIELKELQKLPEFVNLTKDYLNHRIYLFNENPVIHKLSHQHLATRFWIVEIPDLKETGTPISSLENFAVPVLIENFISNFSFMNN